MTNVANLIYDLGCHSGQDSDFYLKKAFRSDALRGSR
jgi:hypothetical protein